MKTIAKLALAALAASTLGAGVAVADSSVMRNNMSNEQPAYVLARHPDRGRGATVGVYQDQRAFGRQATPYGVARIDHANQSPTFIYVPNMNGPAGVR